MSEEPEVDKNLEILIAKTLSTNACATALLDAAMALRNGELNIETFKKVMELCVNWGDSIASQSPNVLKELYVDNMKTLRELIPPPAKVVDVDEFDAAMGEIAKTPQAELPTDVRKKMN